MKIKRQKLIYKNKLFKISLTKVFLGVAFLLTIVQIVLSNNLATSGEKLQTLNEKIEKIELENKKLNSEIAQKVSLSDLSLEAEKIGFVREPEVVNLGGDGVVALKP